MGNCCFDQNSTQIVTNHRNISVKNKKNRKTIQTRILTKYLKQDIVIYNAQQKRNSINNVYTCPICTLYLSKILACNSCGNCICLKCSQQYESKLHSKGLEMKCPFCSSIQSQYKDYELAPKSYFDTTKNGFLSKQQRDKIDQNIKIKSPFKMFENQSLSQRIERSQNLSNIVQQNQPQNTVQEINQSNNRQQNVQHNQQSNLQLNIQQNFRQNAEQNININQRQIPLES